MTERRIKEICCPEHGRNYLCREGDRIICCGQECKFEIEAKRENDMNIASKDAWYQ
jgi:hypothetical protein